MVKKITALIVMVIITVCITYIYFSTVYKQEVPFTPNADSVNEEENEKLKISSVVIESFESKKELIIYEAQLSELVTWDESWGEISIFRKSQRIKFYGQGVYVCNLDFITVDDISVDLHNMTVNITIPKPNLKSITIDEAKTEYEDVNKGWLRFGDIRLSPEQYESMYNTAKQSMVSEMETEVVYNEAVKSAEASVNELVSNLLTAAAGDFSVIVKVTA